MTDWAQLVDTNAPWPEYPRPQMVRPDWLNLNGIWQFQPGAANDIVPTNQTLSGEILVPFPMESALSGVMQHHPRSWYRRTFVVPPEWNGRRILLHLDAVDWESEVFINGVSVGIHRGGYDPITYDITDHLTGSGPQELIVRVHDPTDNYGQARGKQTLFPQGIMYTSTSGIWQTVWLEPVPATRVSHLKLIPDIDAEHLAVTVEVDGPTNDITVHVMAKNGGDVVGSISGAPGAELLLPVPDPVLWSPTNPFLYDLEITLSNETARVDSVASYFGMRKISLGTRDGFVKMLLNDEFVFQFGPLDQGFWPDGIYTAPTDDALKSDIEQTKLLGFNMIRKHIKVEPARWYYWADRLGVLVWQDMPSLNSYTGNPQPIDKPQFQTELARMVRHHWNHPSIISWVIFNESQGQHDTAALVDMVKAMDPSRLVNEASGGSFTGSGDILDWHSYPNPSCPSSPTQAVVCGEFGGVGLPITNHTWAPGWGYVAATNADDLAARFEAFCYQLSEFVQNRGLSAAVYTEITDVEIELNGFLTYDRKVRKPDVERIRAAVALASAPVLLTEVMPTSEAAGQTWKYRTTTPPSQWMNPDYDDSGWSEGQAGFGAGDPPNTAGLVRTTWNTPDIWIRRTFNPGPLTPSQINNLFFRVYHDEDVEIYINGVLAGSGTSYTTTYGYIPLTPEGKAALKTNENNVIAVHCRQTGGGQFIDVGLTVRESELVTVPPPVPETPTGLQGAAGALGVSLGWNTVPHATGYRVKRSLVSGGPYTDIGIPAAVNAITDTSADYSTTYYYVVSALNATGESADSAEISVTTPPPPPPVVPVIAAWFRADAIGGLTNGEPVAVWPDSSSYARHATQENEPRRPKFVNSAINGRPAVRFDSSDETWLSFSRPVEDDFTIFCVFRSDQGVGTGTAFYQGAGLVSGEMPNQVNDFAISLNANGRILAGVGSPDVTLVSTNGDFNDGQPHIVTFTRERKTGVIELWIDGNLHGSVSAGKQSLTAPAELVLGAQQTLLNFLTGDIAEVKIYDAVLEPWARIAEEDALRCKYGLGQGAPPATPADVIGTPGNRQARLEWAPVPGATSYRLNWSLNSAGPYTQVVGGLTGTSYVDSNAVVGRTNYYRVAAQGACGIGDFSAPVAVFVSQPVLASTLDSDALTLLWPDWADDWMLWSTTNLAPPVHWTLVSTPVLVSNGLRYTTVPVTGESAFFRLASP